MKRYIPLLEDKQSKINKVNKLTTLSDAQKKEIVELINKRPEQLLSSINFSRKDISYDELKAALDKETKGDIKKSMKKGTGLTEGKDYLVFKYKDIEFISPLNHRSSCFFGRGAKWCVSMENEKGYWEDYTEGGSVFFITTVKDYMFNIVVDANGIELYNEMDDTLPIYDIFSSTKYKGLTTYLTKQAEVVREKMIEQDVLNDPDYINKQARNALAASDEIKFMDIMQHPKFNCDYVDEHYYPLINVSVYNGLWNVFKELLKCKDIKVNVNAGIEEHNTIVDDLFGHFGGTPFSILKLIIDDKRFNFSNPTKENPYIFNAIVSIIYSGIKTENLQTLEYYIKSGRLKDINETDDHFKTVLDYVENAIEDNDRLKLKGPLLKDLLIKYGAKTSKQLEGEKK